MGESPMHALFEEAGKFMAGRILSEADTSAQVELDSGKRVKVKAANILLKFEKPAPAELIAQAQAVAETIELDLAWEFAPEDDFGFADLARDYFSENATLAQQAGALFRLYEAPHYFRRAGRAASRRRPQKSCSKPWPPSRRKRPCSRKSTSGPQPGRGECPQPIRDQLYKILFKPDKNAPEYKAVVEASRATHTAPLDLLQRRAPSTRPTSSTGSAFVRKLSPRARAFRRWQRRSHRPTCRWHRCRPIPSTIRKPLKSTMRCLCKAWAPAPWCWASIAAPGLAIQPGSAIDQLGRARLSTVYMPGYKITMLPDEVVQIYTLDEGRANPAVSLYVTIDEATLEFTGTETKPGARAGGRQPAPRPARPASSPKNG